MANSIDVRPASVLRRLGAMVSDSLVVLGLMILTTFVTAPPLLSVLGKKAIVPSEVGWGWTSLYWLLMLLVWALYFVLLWSHSGQTVGMRAWRIRVQTLPGAIPTRLQSLQRLGWAILPWVPGYVATALVANWQMPWFMKWMASILWLFGVFGLLMMLKPPAKQTWHDRMSQMRVIFLPKL